MEYNSWEQNGRQHCALCEWKCGPDVAALQIHLHRCLAVVNQGTRTVLNLCRSTWLDTSNRLHSSALVSSHSLADQAAYGCMKVDERVAWLHRI